VIDLSKSAVERRALGFAEHRTTDADLVDRDARMVWSTLIEPGDGVAGALIATYGARPALELALGEDTPRTAARELTEGRRRWLPRADDVESAVAAAVRAGAEVMVPVDADWPHRLDALGMHAPPCLWVRGSRSAVSLDARHLSVVGARAATSYGQYVVGDVVAPLAASGIVIHSGGAYGIDGMAHESALAVGGRTVAWLAGGVDRPYPSGHRDLLRRIAEGPGAVVSDVPCGAAPTKWRFLARNRLIAAAGDAVVVIEAGWRSGSLNTASHAAQLGRPLGAVPGPVTSPASAGCHRLMREHDAQCVTGADDVAEMLGVSAASERLFDDAPSGELTRTLDALSVRVPRPAEEIARRSGQSLEQVTALLGLLALEGGVEKSSDGWRARPR
jgi:DNA processing protein